jgi:hypothetical protein
MIIPKIILKNKTIIIKKKDRSFRALRKYTSFDSLKNEFEGKESPIPPPARRPKLSVDI